MRLTASHFRVSRETHGQIALHAQFVGVRSSTASRIDGIFEISLLIDQPLFADDGAECASFLNVNKTR